MAESVLPCGPSIMDGNLGGKPLPRSEVACAYAYSHRLSTRTGGRCKGNGCFNWAKANDNRSIQTC
jgi:hypothetical protein